MEKEYRAAVLEYHEALRELKHWDRNIREFIVSESGKHIIRLTSYRNGIRRRTILHEEDENPVDCYRRASDQIRWFLKMQKNG